MVFEKSTGMNEPKYFEITTEPLSLDDVAARVTRPDCGGITVFSGVVRGETATDAGTRGTDFLAYEAYTEMAEEMMAAIGDGDPGQMAQGAGGQHPAPGGTLRDRRAQRGHRGGHSPPGRRLLRGVSVCNRAAEGHRSYLETGKLV